MDRNELIEVIKSHDPKANTDLVEKAIDFAIKYHGSQLRESGEPYYSHPLEVAKIIADMKLDKASIITAILHDTVEDTVLTLEDVEREFGDEVAKLVDGVTKLTKLKFQGEHAKQAENFRKLLIAMSEDIRVLLVKLADRLHNMRTIHFVKSREKQMRVALETMEIYAPLAERIGVQQVKLELHDIAFQILHPEIKESISNRLKKLSDDGRELVNRIIAAIQSTLDEAEVKGEVSGRQKTPYSIWMKMKQKNISFEQLSDIIAFRVIVEDIPSCYQALGTIHAKYQMIPESFQDFISTPKSNGYQSLHTVVIGPERQRVEVQIRTKAMHEVAELGVAAHWSYKQNQKPTDGKQYRWIRELLSILDHASDPEEFLQNTKLEMYYDQVFCFTPKGMLIALPKGATTVDFAYAVHSDVGHRCVGSKVNGRIVPLKTVLKNGDQVDIITSKNQTPSPSWERFVITGKARSEIRKFIRSQQRQEYINLGKAILEKSLPAEYLNPNNEASNKILARFNKKTLEELYYGVGEGTISREEITKSISEERPEPEKKKSALSFFKFGSKSKNKEKRSGKQTAVPIKGLIPGMAVHYAGCCHPIPGDKIVGVIHSGKGVTVHTSDCEMLDNFASTPERIIDLTWDSDTSKVPFVGRIRTMLANEPGSLAMLTSEVAKEKGNITNFRITNRNVDFFEIILDIEVAGVDHLNNLINALKSQPQIHSIDRFKL